MSRSEFGWAVGTAAGFLIVIMCLPLIPVFKAVSFFDADR